MTRALQTLAAAGITVALIASLAALGALMATAIAATDAGVLDLLAQALWRRL